MSSANPPSSNTKPADLFDLQPKPDQQAVQNIPGRRSLKKAEKKQSVAKAPSAFRTISEVANELKVEQHVLRFWESKFRQIQPLKRGGGRRYYRPEDIDLIKNIHHLLYNEGYTIKGVQKLLQSTRGNLSARVQTQPQAEAEAVEATSSAVKKNRAELQAMLDELKSLRSLID